MLKFRDPQFWCRLHTAHLFKWSLPFSVKTFTSEWKGRFEFLSERCMNSRVCVPLVALFFLGGLVFLFFIFLFFFLSFPWVSHCCFFWFDLMWFGLGGVGFWLLGGRVPLGSPGRHLLCQPDGPWRILICLLLPPECWDQKHPRPALFCFCLGFHLRSLFQLLSAEFPCSQASRPGDVLHCVSDNPDSGCNYPSP